MATKKKEKKAPAPIMVKKCLECGDKWIGDSGNCPKCDANAITEEECSE